MALAPDFDEQLAQLHGQGMSASAIARKLGCSQPTVSKHAMKLGLSFERKGMEAALEAHRIDAAARRAKLIDRGYTRAEYLYARLEAPQYKYRVVYKDHSAIEVDDEVPANDERAIQTAISGHLASVAKLEMIDAGTQTGKTDSLLDALSVGFKYAADRYTPPEL